MMVQSLRAISGFFSHASNLQISPYLKATRLIQIFSMQVRNMGIWLHNSYDHLEYHSNG
jgi:hypothetical protein